MGEGRTVLLFSKEIYDKEAVLAATYLVTNIFYIDITSAESCYRVEIASKDGSQVPAELANNLKNDCIDQQLRLDLEKKTGKIRELIVQHAFKPLDLKAAVGGNNAR